MTNQDAVKHSYTIKLFCILPIYGWVQRGDKKTWKILGLPVFKIRRFKNNTKTKYYSFGLPLIKVSKKLA